jgi:hypothetical protein
LERFYQSWFKNMVVGTSNWMKTPRQICQQEQHQVLESLKDVKVIADDLLVYENGAKDDEKLYFLKN